MAKQPSRQAPETRPLTPELAEGVRDVKLELDRIIFFSDAVFAIAITLLALDIHFPNFAAEPSDTVLLWAILGILPRVAIFALSFVVVGLYWLRHHRMFRSIQRYDLRLTWLNLFQLLFVALLPASSSLMGLYALHQPVLMLYSLNVIAIGGMQYLLWKHASRNHRLIDPELDARQIFYVQLNNTISIVAFTLTIVISFFSTAVALAIPIIMLVVYVPLAPLLQPVLLRLYTPGR